MITVEGFTAIRVRPARAIAWLDWQIEASIHFPEIDMLHRLAIRV